MSPRYSSFLAASLLVLMVTLMAAIPLQADVQTPGATLQSDPSDLAEAPPLAHQIGFFRRILSKADGDRCSMYPSCSTYAMESLRKHGALVGWIMIKDRLLRCGHDEVRLAPTIRSGQRRRAYDPVSDNDFWWWSPPGTDTTANQ